MVLEIYDIYIMYLWHSYILYITASKYVLFAKVNYDLHHTHLLWSDDVAVSHTVSWLQSGKQNHQVRCQWASKSWPGCQLRPLCCSSITQVNPIMARIRKATYESEPVAVNNQTKYFWILQCHSSIIAYCNMKRHWGIRSINLTKILHLMAQRRRPPKSLSYLCHIDNIVHCEVYIFPQQPFNISNCNICKGL